MLKAHYCRYLLDFKEPGGTSRGILTQKETWFIRIWDTTAPNVLGTGECALFRGLSADDCPGFENKLRDVCQHIDTLHPQEELQEWSAIRFGIETALSDLKNNGNGIPFPSQFTEVEESIEINGLIWMGDKETMQHRIEEKLSAGYRCIKLKIGAIDFQAELALLHSIRSRFGKADVELRVDANGAFTPATAADKLQALAHFDLHSIEQPIRQGQWDEMARLCAATPIPIALDEELIGINNRDEKRRMLESIRPQYIILKPALAGGFYGTKEWIDTAEELGIKWWVTSALESNIGLNAIAQWTYRLNNHIPQGLGTGQIYTNNTPSHLCLQGAQLRFNTEQYPARTQNFLNELAWTDC